MAIKRAAELAEITEYSTYYPIQTVDWRAQLAKRFSGYIGWMIPPYIKDNLAVSYTHLTLPTMYTV